MEYTPELFIPSVTEILVYGTNQFAQHDGGAAKFALNHGAIYENCPIGLCGNTYGIITTSFNDKLITIDFIIQQVNVLYHFAVARPDLTFYVTKIGTGIAGWDMQAIANIFINLEPTRTSNIILPKEFYLHEKEN